MSQQDEISLNRESIRALVNRWRGDPGGTYQTWFLWADRLKNFRSIRRGLGEIVSEIEANTFGTAFKGSSLETVVHSIAEQRRMFKGADHAWLWKPKLRIPDIYENRDNQLAFARFLDTCVCCSTEREVLDAIRALDAQKIKGLGPAAANLLYFLHPTLVPPFNTAIVNGYNALTGANVKLGRWDSYLAMRDGMRAINDDHRDLFSNDLGAIAALLFDIGSERYAAPPRDDDAAARRRWEEDLATVRAESSRDAKLAAEAADGDRTHTDIQGWLRDLGLDLGFEVYVAANDRGRSYAGGRLGDRCLDWSDFSPNIASDAVRLIDVLWLERASETGPRTVAAAFEVEHTTSIYSGIVRLLDLALGTIGRLGPATGLFLVAPDNRENDVRDQLRRPAFSRVADIGVRFIPYSELESHRGTIARFGHGMKPVDAIARSLR